MHNKELCKVTLTEENLDTLRDSIEDLYYFEFVIGMYTILTIYNNVYQFLYIIVPISRICVMILMLVCSLADDIPIRGFIGHLEEGGFLPHHHKTYIWAHLHFNIEYHDNQVYY